MSTDVAVIGAGIAGLMIARRLTRLGYKVTLIERAERVLNGTSSRNEGWLHAGTYHSTSIANRSESVTIGKRCRYGWRQISTDFPECLEPEPHSAVAIVRANMLDETLGRWDDAGVGHRPVNRDLNDLLSDYVNVRSDEHLFAVDDRGINTRMLAALLSKEITDGGGHILLGTHATVSGANCLRLTGHHDGQVEYRLLVLASGFATSSVCADLGVKAPATRLWRSHLISVPRAVPTSVFSIAPLEAAMINHQGWSVSGLNEDARQVGAPTFDTDPDMAQLITDAFKDRFPRARMDLAEVTACVKVDLANTQTAARDLNVRVSRLNDTTICALPGKMTESPFTADVVANQIFDLLDANAVTYRPIDLRSQVETLSERIEALSEQPA